MCKPIRTVEEFITWTKILDGRMLLYRGLADANWNVESSAYRRLSVSDEHPPPRILQEYIKQLLASASIQGFRHQRERELPDLELLAELQHFGAATCLIDFTENALIALWFACREKPEHNGKIVAMATDDPGLFSIVDYEELCKPVAGFLYQGKLWKWTPSDLNNRIVAQQSVFVFGDGAIRKSLYTEIAVEADSKPEIMNALERSFGVCERHIFNDVSGFALNNAHDRPYDDFTAEGHFYWGVRFRQRGQHQTAIDYLGKAIRGKPSFANAYYNRGNAKRDLGDPSGAIADYDEAIEINPKFADAFNNRGNAKGDLGDFNGAIADHDKAIEINPKFANAFNNRGVVKSRLGDHNGAIADYDEATEINPRFADAYYNRGNARGDLGDLNGAIDDYDKAIEFNPQLAIAFNNRGLAKRGLGDEAGAKKDFEAAGEIDPNLKASES